MVGLTHAFAQPAKLSVTKPLAHVSVPVGEPAYPDAVSHAVGEHELPDTTEAQALAMYPAGTGGAHVLPQPIADSTPVAEHDNTGLLYV